MNRAAAFLHRWELPLVVLLAPLFAFPPLGRGVLWITLLIPTMWLICGAAGAEILPRTKFNGALLLLLAAVGVSLFATFDIFFSAPKALGVVLGVAMFFAIVRRVNDDASTAIAFDLFVLAGAALALIGLLGTSWIGKMPLLAPVTAHLPAVIRGVPGQSEGFQPNAIAGALVVFVPVQLAMVIAAGARLRALRIAALVFTTLVLLLTQSRSGWLSLFIALLAWAAWHARGPRRWRIGAVVVVVLIGIAAMFVLARGAAERELGADVRSDVSGRMELWSRAIVMAEDFPFTGVGINGFRRVMPAMYPALLTPAETDVAHAHNHLLTVAAELGVPGLVAYAALWLLIAAMVATILRTTASTEVRWLAGGLGAAFVASFVFGTADVIPLGSKVGIVFWLALALLAVLFDRVRTEAA